MRYILFMLCSAFFILGLFICVAAISAYNEDSFGKAIEILGQSDWFVTLTDWLPNVAYQKPLLDELGAQSLLPLIRFVYFGNVILFGLSMVLAFLVPFGRATAVSAQQVSLPRTRANWPEEEWARSLFQHRSEGGKWAVTGNLCIVLGVVIICFTVFPSGEVASFSEGLIEEDLSDGKWVLVRNTLKTIFGSAFIIAGSAFRKRAGWLERQGF